MFLKALFSIVEIFITCLILSLVVLALEKRWDAWSISYFKKINKALKYKDYTNFYKYMKFALTVASNLPHLMYFYENFYDICIIDNNFKSFMELSDKDKIKKCTDIFAKFCYIDSMYNHSNYSKGIAKILSARFGTDCCFNVVDQRIREYTKYAEGYDLPLAESQQQEDIFRSVYSEIAEESFKEANMLR